MINLYKTLFAVVILSLVTGCSQFTILFKPPAQLDPVPASKVERAKVEKEKESVSWSMSAIGLTDDFYRESAETRGNVNIRVAILSTGIDYNHEDLIGQVQINRQEITEAVDINPSINYKDDDGNGEIDDIAGKDFVDGDGLGFDRHGAGTAVAGIIAAKTNGYGVKGILDLVSLIPVRYINENGQSDVPKLAQALEYARKVRADVVFVQNIDLPLGGGFMVDPTAVEIEKSLIRSALSKFEGTDIPIVVGAGESLQDFKDTSLGGVFLSSANVIAVTSTDQVGRLSLLANRGNRTVKLAAPGDKILTTAPGNRYKEVRGTAYAAAHVAGVLALAKSMYGDRLSLKDHILPAISSPRSGTASDYFDQFTVVSGTILSVPKLLNVIEERL